MKKKSKEKKKHSIKVEKEKKQRQQEKRSLILKKLKGNSLLIQKLLFEKNIRGDYRDFIVLSGPRLYHYFGVLELADQKGRNLNSNDMILMHKKEMWKIFDEETTLKFWHPKLGRLGATLQPPKKK